MKRRKGQQRKKNADEGGVNGIWNEIDRMVVKENAGEHVGNGMLNERKNGQQRKNAGEGGGNGMLNEGEGKASKGECW